jgi:hypothetical protein
MDRCPGMFAAREVSGRRSLAPRERDRVRNQAIGRAEYGEPIAGAAAGSEGADATDGWGGRTRTSIAGSKGRCLTGLATPQRSRL